MKPSAPEAVAARPRVRFHDLPGIVAPPLGLSHPHIREFALKLRDARILPVRGRRCGAADMGARELAALILAIIGDARPSRAPDAFAALADLAVVKEFLDPDGRLVGVAEDWTATATLGAGCTAVDLVAAILADARDGHLNADLRSGNLHFGEVRASAPDGQIRLGLTPAAQAIGEHPIAGRVEWRLPLGYWRTPAPPAEPIHGLRQERAISLAALATIGKQLR